MSQSEQLEHEQRAWIVDLVQRAGIHSVDKVSETLAEHVAKSMRQFREEQAAQATWRKNHNALRRLHFLAYEDDPPLALIRILIGKLPSRARNEIQDRARRLWPRVFPGESLDDFLEWSKYAPSEKLLEAVRTFVPSGGKIVPGRRRADGKRSRSRFEPLILSVVRGEQPSGKDGSAAKSSVHDPAPPGRGRPRALPQDYLVMLSGLDWQRVTGQLPEHGRSDRTAFGALVHHVFGWLGLDKLDQAGQALRRYWAAVDSAVITEFDDGIEYR
jgi:hypothetical protein